MLPRLNHHVPFAVLRRGRMVDKVAVDPSNGVAHLGRDLDRREGEIADLDLHGLPASAETALATVMPTERRAIASGLLLFETGCDLLGVLLVALENLEAGLQQALQFGVFGRRDQRLLKSADHRLVEGDFVIDIRLVEGST